ncbi:MAG TPA: CDP-alcohol phosphatidyltransferase family protein [Solirubrobacteraceae bacterium]|nr:CDP-alcohol phosphatidyltransferase family protein [Solirubrobacteraceae bacterium]
MTSPRPSIAELRAVTQPESTLRRASAEHWAGPLYMRRISPYATRLLLRAGLSANGVTWLMIPSGVLAAACLTLPGLAGALGCVLFIQLQFLFDCSDGEVARWRRESSATGVYLDRIAHHVTDAALPAALGVRAAGGWDSLDGWTTLGLLVAVLVLLIKAETQLVAVARAEAGLPRARDATATAAPRPTLLRRARRALAHLPFFRAFVPVEASLLALAAALADIAAGDLTGTRVLLAALVPIAAVTAVGHLVGVLTSERLR